MKKNNRWGILLSVFSVICIGLSIYLVLQFPAPVFIKLYSSVFPVLGTILSVLAFFTGHFSYPRVHNLKVYLAGYLTGLTGLAYFLLFSLPHRNDNAITALLLLIFINFTILMFIPSYAKYRTTKQITFIIVGVECILLLICRFYTPSIIWTEFLSRSAFFSIPSILGLLWLLDIIVISIFRLRDEFHLGGLLSGSAFLYYIIWITPLFPHQLFTAQLETVCFVFVILYLEIGIIVHWIARMEHRISYDPLLHIYNRNYCSKIIEEQSNTKTTPPLGIAMIDIDHFKKVNDTHGHQVGDKVLYYVAQVILREVIPDGIACRYGGEEIIVFFPDKTTRQVCPVVENVRAAIEATKIPLHRKKLSVTVSCGVSQRESTAQSIMDVISAADKALYRAKKGGRNQVKTGKTPLPELKKK